MNIEVEQTFEATDADGKTHEYRVVPNTAVSGLDITLKLTAIGAEPLGTLADSLFSGSGAGKLKGLSVGSLLDDETILDGIDFAKIGGDIRRTIVQSSMAIPSLIHAVLKNTLRDGKPLESVVHFNDAFTRNYGELFVAVFKVIQVNRFLPLSAISVLGKRG